MKSYEEVYNIVKNELSEKRFIHSENVAQRCVIFAKLNGVDVEKARLVGIAHDIAKEIPKADRIRISLENNIKLDDIEKENTNLIHAKLGAKLCRDRFGFTDDMCKAIEAHTTAKPNMSLLDKILYLADYCEPNRAFDTVNTIFELGKKNLNSAYYTALVGKIIYTLNKGIKLHIDSINAYNSLIDNKLEG
ncbi:MAG: bis(5'-nucleosyl)-tetraphosphatase (symmetrical) YqeK [Clostridia bacterium]|nr:bis(5'-nucleosyl)-tetraphosphatase (symmetrical) YqeK [Clostridia bacterium]